MLKRLIEISRPLLWVNTIGTTVLGMWLGGDLWRWDIVALLLFATLPFNLLIYGVNDVYDQDTDALNPRKGGVEGALIKPSEAKMIMIGTAVLNIPFLIYFAFTLPIAATLWIAAYAFCFLYYSMPPLRFKARPILDSICNTSYAYPLVYVPLAFDKEPIWWAAIGLMTWSMAKHSYDAIQDIDEDSAVGIHTTATLLGVRGTAIWGAVWWTISTVCFAVVNIPVAIANAAIAGYLVIKLYRKPTQDEAHRLYKYSIAFPYVAGTVAGVQLVAGMLLGFYP